MELPKDAPAVKLWHAIPAEALVAELRTNLEARTQHRGSNHSATEVRGSMSCRKRRRPRY